MPEHRRQLPGLDALAAAGYHRPLSIQVDQKDFFLCRHTERTKRRNSAGGSPSPCQHPRTGKGRQMGIIVARSRRGNPRFVLAPLAALTALVLVVGASASTSTHTKKDAGGT